MLTAKQVAERTGLNKRTVYDIPLTDLPRYKYGKKSLRWREADVERYIERCLCTTTPSDNSGVGNSIEKLKASDNDLLRCFRKVGIEPKRKGMIGSGASTITRFYQAQRNQPSASQVPSASTSSTDSRSSETTTT